MFASNAMIGNGGFEGLFSNPSGEYADLLPDAADRFGLPALAQAAKDALLLFEGDYPVDFAERDALWNRWLDEPETAPFERFARELDRADAVWWAGEDDLVAALAAFARASFG